MVVFTREINQAVLGEYGLMGFRLEEDDHILKLYFKDKFIAYPTSSVTVEELRTICEEEIRELNLCIEY